MPFFRTLPGSAWPALPLLAMGSALAVLSCSDAPREGGTTAGLIADGGAPGADTSRDSGATQHSARADELAAADDSAEEPEDTAGDSTLAEACDASTLACATNKWIGAAVNAEALEDVPLYAEVLAREFDYITPENVMKWGPLQPEQGVWDFSAADALLARAAANSQSVKGHALVWHLQEPPWTKALTEAALIDAVQSHVSATVRHFQGKLRAWDVVNEAIADEAPNRIREGIHSTLGISGMANAFKRARAADPNVKLFYNDYGIEGLNSKSDAVYRLLQRLIAAGAPIDGVGFQSHFSTKSYPSLPALRANIRRFAALGLSVNISELDVRTREVPGTRAQRRAAQAIAYQEVASACATTSACEALTLWGFTDAYSWVDEYFGADDPLPFDEQYAKKPAYAGLRAGLSGTRLQASANLVPMGNCESETGWSVFAGGSLSLVSAGRNGNACKVSGRTQAYHGPSLALTGKAQQGDTLRVTAYARLSIAGSVRMTLKKAEPGKEDEYLSLASGAADSSGWTLLSGNVTMGWQTVPSELVLYFESPAVGSTYASLFVDDVTVQVLSRP
jgi:endo-1,4-beta-xylanase